MKQKANSGVEKVEDWRRGHLLMAVRSLKNQEMMKMGVLGVSGRTGELREKCHTGLICRQLLLHCQCVGFARCLSKYGLCYR